MESGTQTVGAVAVSVSPGSGIRNNYGPRAMTAYVAAGAFILALAVVAYLNVLAEGDKSHAALITAGAAIFGGVISLGNGFARSSFEEHQRRATESFQREQRKATEKWQTDDSRRRQEAAKELEVLKNELSDQLVRRQKTFEIALAHAFDNRKKFDETLRQLDDALQRALKPLELIVNSADVWDDDTMLQNAAEAFQAIGAFFTLEATARQVFRRWKREELVETCIKLRREFTDSVLALAKTKAERDTRRGELLADYRNLLMLRDRLRDAVPPTIQQAIMRLDEDAASDDHPAQNAKVG